MCSIPQKCIIEQILITNRNTLKQWSPILYACVNKPIRKSISINWITHSFLKNA
ncbi:MAG: hypothetical protein ACI8P3_000906 [Saprospiraceae bacterium]|jgi:hypothetical protein